jgi:hypothetical protein
MMGTCSQDDERRVSYGKDGEMPLKNIKRKKCLFVYVFLGGIGDVGKTLGHNGGIIKQH